MKLQWFMYLFATVLLATGAVYSNSDSCLISPQHAPHYPLSVLVVGMPRTGSTALYNIVRLVTTMYDPNVIAGWLLPNPQKWVNLNVSVVVKAHNIDPDKMDPRYLRTFNLVVTSHRDRHDAMRSSTIMNMLEQVDDVLVACQCNYYPPDGTPVGNILTGTGPNDKLTCNLDTQACIKTLDRRIGSTLRYRCRSLDKMQEQIYATNRVVYDLNYDDLITNQPAVIRGVGRALGYCLSEYEINLVDRQVGLIRATGSAVENEPHHPVTLMHGDHKSAGGHPGLHTVRLDGGAASAGKRNWKNGGGTTGGGGGGGGRRRHERGRSLASVEVEGEVEVEQRNRSTAGVGGGVGSGMGRSGGGRGHGGYGSGIMASHGTTGSPITPRGFNYTAGYDSSGGSASSPTKRRMLLTSGNQVSLDLIANTIMYGGLFDKAFELMVKEKPKCKEWKHKTDPR